MLYLFMVVCHSHTTGCKRRISRKCLECSCVSLQSEHFRERGLGRYLQVPAEQGHCRVRRQGGEVAVAVQQAAVLAVVCSKHDANVRTVEGLLRYSWWFSQLRSVAALWVR